MTHWLNQIHNLFEAKTPFVVATIWSIEGTSPDSAGARLVVTNTSCDGQLQSTHRRQELVKQCRTLLSEDGCTWLEKIYPLGDVAGTANGHCVVVFEKFIADQYPDWLKEIRKSIRDGQQVWLKNQVECSDERAYSHYEVIQYPADESCDEKNQQTRVIHTSKKSKTLLQKIQQPEMSIAVVGHSQVAVSLVQQLLLLPVQIQWIAKQFDGVDPHTPNLHQIALSDTAIASLGIGTSVAIATNDHELDIHCCHRALCNHHLSYIGCLGSSKKAQIVKQHLTELGVSDSRLQALTIPIGLQSITGKQPSIIAASIVAQLLSGG